MSRRYHEEFRRWQLKRVACAAVVVGMIAFYQRERSRRRRAWVRSARKEEIKEQPDPPMGVVEQEAQPDPLMFVMEPEAYPDTLMDDTEEDLPELPPNPFMELRREDPEKFGRCMCMTLDMFEWLVAKVRPIIEKKDTRLRRCITVEERLSVTLRHLATGETQESLSSKYGIGQSTISGIVKSTCIAIYKVLQREFLTFPTSADEWKSIATDYSTHWKFDNCLGVIDGRHIRIELPIQKGSLYGNDRRNLSVVLLTVINAKHQFVYADVDMNGRVSDKNVWNRSPLKSHLENNTLNIPNACPLPGIETPFPFVFIADQGFNLTERVLTPFPEELLINRQDKEVFNHRLSVVRRCADNAFGVMFDRFQIFKKPLRYDLENAKNVVLAVLCLHNLLRDDPTCSSMNFPPHSFDREDEGTGQRINGEWQDTPASGVVPLVHEHGTGHATFTLRDQWSDYFNNAVSVPMQDQMMPFNSA